MSNSGGPDELRDWSFAREQIGHTLKTFYERCLTDELPPRLRALIENLDNEKPEPQKSE